jgi:hypothetical protein
MLVLPATGYRGRPWTTSGRRLGGRQDDGGL